MGEGKIISEVPAEKLHLLSKEELIELAKQEREAKAQLKQKNRHLEKENEYLRALTEELKQRILILEDQYVVIKNKLFGKSSERTSASDKDGPARSHKERKSRIQLPSQRYPNAPLIERSIALQELPYCKCCGSQMEDSGMTEDSEYLTAIPRQYLVVRQKRHKYRCGKCHERENAVSDIKLMN